MNQQSMEKLSRRVRAIEEKMVTKEELEALIDTVEILSNPATMAQIRASEADIKAGRVKEIRSVEDLFAELSE
ncbi:MAG: hypothetical protein DPW13_11885 [Planctomycetes bacterium]|nr:hypothetical protein [Planctomycetota bacterium]